MRNTATNMKLTKPFKNCKPNKISSHFGHIGTNYHTKGHKGTDFVSKYGTYLVAPEDVMITKVVTGTSISKSLEELRRGYGVTMKSQETSGVYYRYWHCLPMFPVEAGQIVKRGQIVAQMGNSGLVWSIGQFVPVEVRVATKQGTHLHYEGYTIKDGKKEYFDIAPKIDYTLPIHYDLLTAIRNILQKISNLLKVVILTQTK